jgi:NTP pyrophosphatase (non-canonical NTP hydrolase)
VDEISQTEIHSPVQQRAVIWAKACFGEKEVMDRKLRALRFLEEAIELVQAAGLNTDEVDRIRRYVYGRPTGEVAQEVGGVMVTLGTLCHAFGVQMNELGHHEVERCWRKISVIREKNRNKPRFDDAHR